MVSVETIGQRLAMFYIRLTPFGETFIPEALHNGTDFQLKAK